MLIDNANRDTPIQSFMKIFWGRDYILKDTLDRKVNADTIQTAIEARLIKEETMDNGELVYRLTELGEKFRT